MAHRAADGATSADVSNHIRDHVPAVAKDTVGSLLSRLKGDGALVFDGERYYDVKYVPKAGPRPFEPKVVG
jgi:hypothetical protein